MITMTVSMINHGGHLLVIANVRKYSHFNANGLSDYAQKGQSENVQVQTGVQRRP